MSNRKGWEAEQKENHPQSQKAFRKVKDSNVWQILDSNSPGVWSNYFRIKILAFSCLRQSTAMIINYPKKLGMSSTMFLPLRRQQKLETNRNYRSMSHSIRVVGVDQLGPCVPWSWPGFTVFKTHCPHSTCRKGNLMKQAKGNSDPRPKSIFMISLKLLYKIQDLRGKDQETKFNILKLHILGMFIYH